MATLQNLTAELLDEILLYLDQSTLANISLSCRRLYRFAEPQLYAKVLLRDCSGSCFLRSIRDRPSLAQLARDIKFVYDKACADEHAAEAFVLLPNLKNITIASQPSLGDIDGHGRSPDRPERPGLVGLNDEPIGKHRFSAVFRKAKFAESNILNSLESCTLYYRGCGLSCWDLGTLNEVFLHQGMKTLHIEKATFHFVNTPDTGDLFWTDTEHGGITNLETLVLFDCNVDGVALERALYFPRALKQLQLTYSLLDWRLGFVDRGSVETPTYVKALEQQRHSLESLQLLIAHRADGTAYQRGPALRTPAGARLVTLTSLKDLVIDLEILFGLHTQQSGYDLVMNWPGASAFLPQSLENLSLRFEIECSEENGLISDDNYHKIMILLRLAEDIGRSHLPALQKVTLVERRLFNKIYSGPTLILDLEAIYASAGVQIEFIPTLPHCILSELYPDRTDYGGEDHNQNSRGGQFHEIGWTLR